jgi:hypothetical protein
MRRLSQAVTELVKTSSDFGLHRRERCLRAAVL